MKINTLSILFVLLVPAIGCRSQKESVTIQTTAASASYERHADSVVQAVSVGVTEKVTETETTFVVIRPDSLGRLQEVARDVVRTRKTEKTKTQQSDTATFHAETVVADTAKAEAQEQIIETKNQETHDERKGRAAAFGAGVWFAFSLLAVDLIIILWLKWKSRL